MFIRVTTADGHETWLNVNQIEALCPVDKIGHKTVIRMVTGRHILVIDHVRELIDDSSRRSL